MKKLSNTEAELKKVLLIKKLVYREIHKDIYKKRFDDLLIFFRLLLKKMSFQNPRVKNFFLETITDWL